MSPRSARALFRGQRGVRGFPLETGPRRGLGRDPGGGGAIIIIIIIYSAKQTRMNKTNKYKYIEKKDKQYVTNQKTTHFKVARINKSETEPL